MSTLDHFLFLLSLLLTISGSVSLYTQAQELERQAAACHKMQLRQVATFDGF